MSSLVGVTRAGGRDMECVNGWTPREMGSKWSMPPLPGGSGASASKHKIVCGTNN